MFLFLYRNIQENAILCMNETGNVHNVFFIVENFEARCSNKIFLLKKECSYSLICLINYFLIKKSVMCEI